MPFQPEVARLATLAAGRGMPVPIVPAGFAYERGERWQATLRFGAPVIITHRQEEPAARATVEAEVRRLSAPIVTDPDARTS